MQPVDLGIPGLTDARVLGRGGFGTVHSATEPEFGRTVAVKILRERLDDEAVRRAFARECQAMGALSGHPHIVTVHRGGTTAAGAPYIVMDLMSGGSLADRVKKGPMPWAEVLETGILLASALETAHRRGILHLDLKPANVLVSRYGEPKLADFGISRLPGVAETSDTVRASPAFAAPERLADGTATVATDLYGFGATLFTLLTGAPAFQGESAELIVILARIVRQPVPDLRGEGVPDPVCRVVERLMAKSPGDRYATAADTVTALQDAQRATGRPITRAVIEGGPTTTQEAAARTSLAIEMVDATGSPAGRAEPTRSDLAGAAGPPGAPRAGDRGSSWPEPVRAGHAPAVDSPTMVPPTGALPVSWPVADRPAWPAPGPVSGATAYAAPAGAPGRATSPPPAARPTPPHPGAPPSSSRPGAPGTSYPGTAAFPHPGPSGSPHDPPGAWPPTARASAPTGTGRPRWRRLAWALGAAVVAAAVAVTVAVLNTPSAPNPDPTASTPTTAVEPPSNTVDVAADVTNGETENVRVLLQDYVAAINEERYEDAFALFSQDSPTASGGLQAWLDVQQPRRISGARIVGVSDVGPDGVVVTWTFRSRQDPSYSPDGQQDCLDWELSYGLAGPSPDWLIRTSSAVTDPRPC